MTSYVDFAHYDWQNKQLQISYIKNYTGLVKNRHIDYLEATPKGDWTTVAFGLNDCVSYSEFLNVILATEMLF